MDLNINISHSNPKLIQTIANKIKKKVKDGTNDIRTYRIDSLNGILKISYYH